MTAVRNDRHDLTEGPVTKRLVLFAIPLLFGTLVQHLYNTVDLIFVGNYVGKSASAAIGASSLLITCLIGFFGGMSVGAGVVISQLYGAKDMERLRSAVGCTAALALAGGAVLMTAGYLLAPAFLRLINTPESIRADAAGATDNLEFLPAAGDRGEGRKRACACFFFRASDFFLHSEVEFLLKLMYI